MNNEEKCLEEGVAHVLKPNLGETSPPPDTAADNNHGEETGDDDDSESELMKAISRRSRDGLDINNDTSISPAINSDDNNNNLGQSRNEKNRIAGAIQPGAFGAAPGVRPCRNQSIVYSEISLGNSSRREESTDVKEANMIEPLPTTTENSLEPSMIPMKESTKPMATAPNNLAEATMVEEAPEESLQKARALDDASNVDRLWHNRYLLLGLCGAVLMVAVVAISVGVWAAARRGSTTTSAEPTSSPTSFREVAVRDEVTRVVGDVVNEEGTLHSLALDWIIYEDPMQLSQYSVNLIQRYILVLFYLQTSQKGPWVSCNPPAVEGEDDDCIYYDMFRNSDNSVDYIPRNETSGRWLSGKHECEWAEVSCYPDQDGDVFELYIMGQNLTGTLPIELSHLTSLQWLTLSFNNFVGTIPEAYGEFSLMTAFEATDNHLTGQIPGGFFRQPVILQINLAHNPIKGTIPTEIGNLSYLHSLYLFNTDIYGSLPSQIGKLENVRNLWLFDNRNLTGPIPSQIGHLSLLEELKLSSNTGHTGPLPSEIGLLPNLKEFMVARNNMGGSTIPEEFWMATNLIHVDLDGAGFRGTISTRIGQMTNLQGLKASRNQFSGTIPTQLGLLDDLMLLWIHVNENLGGEVPIEVCQLRGSEGLLFLNADCAGNESRVSCLPGCCTGCCDEFQQCQVV